MLLFVAAVFLIRIPAVQTFVTARVTAYLSGMLHTRVEVKRVDIEFFKKLVLKDIYIEDLHQDTLLYASKLKADISLLDLNNHLLTIALVELHGGVIGLKRYKEDDDLNLVKLLEQIKMGKGDTTAAAWKFNIRNIFLVDNHFTFRDLRWDDYTPCIDFEDVDVSHINAHLESIEFLGDSVFFNARNISLREKKGFYVRHLNAKAKIAPDEMRFNDLDIETSGSSLKGQLTFSYESFKSFRDFLEKVHFNSSFQKSILDSRDIAYFAKELIGLDKKVNFSGDIRGTVNNIKGRNMDIACLDHTRFRGNVSLRGLPDLEETFIDLLVDQLVTSKQDIESIPGFPFDQPGNIRIPENLDALGVVRFKGKFTGFYNDFVAYGNLQSALGFLSSDINLKFDKDLNKSSYAGNISASSFHAGKLLLIDKYLGEITCKAKISGTGFSMNKVNALLEGSVSDMDLYGYHYTNIQVKGQIAKRLFSGNLNVEDENIKLDFNGKVDFSGELPVFDFYAGLRQAYLGHLHLSNRDTGSMIGCEAFFNFKGNTIDNITGTLQLKDITYLEHGILYKADELALFSGTDESGKTISLKSDFVDANFHGQFRLSSAVESFRNMLGKYIPAMPSHTITVSEPHSFTYAIDFKKTADLCILFLPDLYIEPGTSLEGHYNSAIDDFGLQLRSRRIAYDIIDFNHIALTGFTQHNRFKLQSNVGEFFIHDSLKLHDINLALETNRDSANLSIVIADYDSLPNSLNLKSLALFREDGRTLLTIEPSLIKLENKKWDIHPENLVTFDSTGMKLEKIVLTSGNEKVEVSGIISSRENDVLEVKLTDFRTPLLNKVLAIYDINIGGTANGTIRLSAVSGDIKLASDLSVKDFSFFEDTLGNAFSLVSWEKGRSMIDIDGHIDRNDFKNIEIKGRYYLKKEAEDSMAFDIHLRKFPVQTFNHFLKGIFSDLRGLLNVDVKLYGSSREPLVDGSGNFQKTAFTIDYLNTRYSFSHDFKIDDKQISFDNLIVNDEHGNKATVSGGIYHHHLREFFFSLVIRATNLQCLHTTAAQNDIFYGNAYGTGVVKISGDPDFLSMNISLKSERGTLINLPLSNPVEVKNKAFINFVSAGDTLALKEKLKVDLRGIDMEFDLEITPDAEIKLIFDEKIGDVITGRGSGNINLSIDPLGTFNIYGNYEISSGNYLFTLQNLINKDFRIDKGGTIRWNGDPYDAQINIEALYKLNAVLNDLIQDTSSDSYNKRYPVELHLHLTEKLFNPRITFNVVVPNLDPATESIVTRYLKSEEDINTQVFSLLLARRFSRPRDLQNSPNIASSNNPVGENAAELLSTQVSQWISQISSDFDLGVNYRPGNQVTRDEFEVMVSTSILNDRISIDGNVGVASNSQSSSNIVGDFNIEYKVSPDGRFRVKAFNKTNNNSLINANNSLYTQGIGVFYRRDFDSWSDLLKRIREQFRKNKSGQKVTPAIPG